MEFNHAYHPKMPKRMKCVLEFINNQYQVWDYCQLLSTDAVDTTEIWIHHDSKKTIVRQRTVLNSDMDNWLNNTSEQIQGLEFSMILRLVWVKFQHTERIKHISSIVLRALLGHFHIELAHDWNQTCFAGSAQFPDVCGMDGPVFSYSTCNHPKVAAAWSYTPSNQLTQGIYFAEPSQMSELRSLVESLADVATHPMLTALVFGISLSGLIDAEHTVVKERVRSVEVRTRFHSWATRKEAPAEGDYLTLSALITGAKTRLANLHRRVKIIHELYGFMCENCCFYNGKESQALTLLHPPETNIIKLMSRYTLVIEKRAILQEADVQFFQERAEAQLISLSNLLAQEQARVSNNLATAMQQDSLSLKTLSLVTMFFLPGTFLATLFSVPLLKWNQDGDGDPADGQFWIYWAFAIPLTLLTFGTWGVWTYVLDKKAQPPR